MQHALGSKYKDGTMVGSCKYADVTVFSLHPVKTIACGEVELLQQIIKFIKNY